MTELFNPFSLEGKQILVTGASSGIGRGIAIACAKMGATVFVTGRNENRLRETLAYMPDGDHMLIAADLTKENDCTRLASEIPNVDGVVHCAGILHTALARMITPDEVEQVMKTNFQAPVILQSKLLLFKKIKKACSIVFVSSAGYNSAVVGNSIYAASKGALISYANCLKLELAPRLIRVNCVCPGMVWTESILHKGDITKEEYLQDEQRYLLKRYGNIDDVSNLVIYLMSDASSWMTGQNIEIAGGIQKL